MSNMKELYEKVAADSALQAKFNEIMSAAEKDGKESTEAKLIAFAKEAGYAVTADEMKAYLERQGELTDSELDLVAGGKGLGITLSVITVGVGCGALSAYVSNSDLDTSCTDAITNY